MDPALSEDVVKVDVAVVDPDAVVALGHCIVCDTRMVLAHIVLNLDDLQRVE
jgi:hypothetical protein